MGNLFEEINKLSLSVTILIVSVILGGFYYASQISKQNSIERQQQIEIQTKKEAEQTALDEKNKIVKEKSSCVYEAQKNAISLYENSYICTSFSFPPSDCTDNSTYLNSQYNTAYDTCLQKNGLK